MSYAYVTLVSSDEYALGAIGLNYSINKFCKYPLEVLVSSDCSIETQSKLLWQGLHIRIVKGMKFKDSVMQYVTTVNKLYAFNLIEYSKLCFIDCDALVYKNIDYVFDKGDFIFDNHANYNGVNKVCGGIFVFTPSADLFNKLISDIRDTDTEDEVILDRWFKDYKANFPLAIEVLHKAGLPKYWQKINEKDLKITIDKIIEQRYIR